MLQDFVYFSGKRIFSGEFLSMSELKTRILKNSSSLNGCFQCNQSNRNYVKNTIKKTIQNCKKTKEFLPVSFDKFIFICSDIITLNTVPCSAIILHAN